MARQVYESDSSFETDSEQDETDEYKALLKGGVDNWDDYDEQEPQTSCHCCAYLCLCGLTHRQDAKFGINFHGMNLFGLYFLGCLITAAMEVQYVLISYALKGHSTLEGGSWRFSYLLLHYNYADVVFAVFWAVFLVASLMARVCCLTCEDRSGRGAFYGYLLLILACIPAGMAGMVWQADMNLAVPAGATWEEEENVHSGWLVFVITPLLWPLVCSCFLFIAAAVGSCMRVCCGVDEPRKDKKKKRSRRRRQEENFYSSNSSSDSSLGSLSGSSSPHTSHRIRGGRRRGR